MGAQSTRLAVFCDFDGTFSVQDVGATLAARHAGDRRPAQWARYERGEITAWEYNMEILDGFALPEGVLEEFLQSVELRGQAALGEGHVGGHGAAQVRDPAVADVDRGGPGMAAGFDG